MGAYSRLKPEGYLPRVADKVVREALSQFGGVEVCGPRWCGKSWTSMAHGNSITRVDENPSIYTDDPRLALLGERPHVVDEWQDVPSTWNAARHAIDDAANAPGQFLLTGSSAPLERAGEGQRHSGAGRIARVAMSTMTQYEMGVASGGVSLAGLFEGKFAPAACETPLDDLARRICLGGWPVLAGRGGIPSDQIVGQYLEALFERSVPKAGMSPLLARRIASSLARNIATSATLSTIGADAAAGEVGAPTDQTVSSYLEEFRRNYFLDLLPGWDAPVRSKSRLRTKPKRYLADPSLVAGLLGVDADRLLEDAQLFGLLFESLVVHDLAVFARCLPGYTRESLRYYADADGLEVDLVIELSDGRWAGLEIKLGESKVDQGLRNLNRLRRKVASNPAARNPKPSFMAVVLGRGVAARYVEDEDAYVLPFDLLEP